MRGLEKEQGIKGVEGRVESSSTAPDEELVRLAREGDKRAFVEIVVRYQGMVCGVALGILGDFAASEDVGQEAFLIAWRKIGELRDPERLRWWLGQIARNAALGQLRRSGRNGRKEGAHEGLESAVDLADESPGPAESAATEEETALVREALANMPEQYRAPLVLYYREGQSVRAVAEALELSEDAVKQRLVRGREMLRERMAGVIERVLTRTSPGPVFTMMVAAAIGALAAPAAVAGAVFTSTTAAAGAMGSAGSTTATSIITAMSTKTFLGTAALVAVLCIPVGYRIGSKPEQVSNVAVGGSERTNVVAASKTRPSFEESALFAEWRALHEQHGTNSAAMPTLHKAISELKDPLRRRAFHTALVAEWVEIDPASGLSFYLQKARDLRQLKQFGEEWLAADARAAVDEFSRQAGGENLLREYLPEIARRLPERLAEIVSKLEIRENRGTDMKVQDAFAVLAERGVGEARKAAEGVSGPNRTRALAGVGRVWAKSDFDGALAWAREFPEGADRGEILRAILMGQAAVDPVAALDGLEMVPPGGDGLRFGSSAAEQVLREAANADFERTVEWVKAHPGKLNREDLTGLSREVTERLNADASGFLTLAANEGWLPDVMPAVQSALLNLAFGQASTVWEWLKAQRESETIRDLRKNLMGAAAHDDPGLAFRMVEELPQTGVTQNEIKEFASRLLNGGDRLDRFDLLVDRAPEKLRPVLVEQAFNALMGEAMPDPQVWIERLSMLPEEGRAKGIAGIARAWAMDVPEEAIRWVSSLPEGEARGGAMEQIAWAWARQDVHSAAEWVTSIPAGLERDRAAQELVSTVAEKYPHEAWQWSLSIRDPEQQKKAVLRTARVMSLRDPVTMQRWIENAPLASETRAELETVLRLAGAGDSKQPKVQ